MPTIDDVMHEIVSMRQEFRDHVANESPVIRAAQAMNDIHGSIELVRARIGFINAMIEREEDRKKLRKAIIEKTTVGAIWALLIYVAFAIGHEIRDTIQGWVTR